MPNPIKYNTNTESNALKIGNFYIGTGDTNKGPTNITGYWNGIDPPSNGYAIYVNKASGGPSIRTASNDSELISITNDIANTSYTTVDECFNYFRGQNDKFVLNKNFDPIITDDLVMYLDTAYSPSFYSGSSNWYDLVNTDYSASLIGNMTYSSTYGGVLSAEGSQTSNYIILPYRALGDDITSNSSWSLDCWIRLDSTSGTTYLFSTATTAGGSNGWIMQVSSGKVFPWNENQEDGGGAPYTAGETLHITLSISNGKMYIYKNGSYTGRYGYTKNIEGAYAWVLNQEQDGTLSGFDASQATDMGIYSIKVYNKTLSASEVLQNYNAQKSRFGL